MCKLVSLTVQLGLARLDLAPGSPAVEAVTAAHEQARWTDGRSRGDTLPTEQESPVRVVLAEDGVLLREGLAHLTSETKGR
jgi:hypothetical protein